MKNIKTLRIVAAIAILCSILIGYSHGAGAGVVAFIGSGLALEMQRPHTLSALRTYTGTTLADIFIPEIYADIQAQDRTDTLAFAQAGVAVTNPLLQKAAQSGTKNIEIPIWNDLDVSTEPNYSDESDDDSEPDNVDSTSLNARNAYMNKSYGVTDLATEISGATPGQGNPMTRIKNRFGAYWNYQFQQRLIAIGRGVLAKNIAANSGDMLHNIALETTVGLGDSNKISAEAVVAACFTMGDQFNNLKVIAMHSVVYQRLVNQQLIEFVKDADGTMLYQSYLGKRVVVDDGLPVIAGTTSGLKYVTILFGAGAIGYGEGKPTVPAEVFREPTKGLGGGREQIIERKTWLIHPAGWDWTDSSVAGETATLAELRTASNWSRVFSRKNVPMAFLQTNG